MVSKHEQQVLEQEKYYEDKAYKKDSEKRQFDWKLAGAVSGVVLFATGIVISALTGGDVKFKLPNKN